MNLWAWLIVAAAVTLILVAARHAHRQRRTPSAVDARSRPRTRATGLSSTYYKEL